MILVYEQDRALASDVQRELERTGFEVRLLDTFVGLWEVVRTTRPQAVLYQLDANSFGSLGYQWGALGEAGVPLVATGTRGRIYRAFQWSTSLAVGLQPRYFRALERPYAPVAAREALEAAIREASAPVRPADERWREAARLAWVAGEAMLISFVFTAVLAGFLRLGDSSRLRSPWWMTAGMLGMATTFVAPRLFALHHGIRPPRWAVAWGAVLLALFLGTLAAGIAR